MFLNLNLFKSLFRGRDDVYAIRWEKDGRGGYMPAYKVDWSDYNQHKAKGGNFANYDKKEYLPYYSTHLLGINKPVTYSVKAEERHGIIRGINEEGHLIVELPSGEMEELFGQEIHLSSSQFAKGGN